MTELWKLVQQDLRAPETISDSTGYWWLCPFHHEETASLQVDFYARADKWRWKCWGCGREGDAFDWLTTYRGLSNGDAWRLLHGEASTPPATQDQRAPAFNYGSQPPAQDWQEAALDAVLRCAANLREVENVQRYLSERGIRPATWERALLGWNASWQEVQPGVWLAPGLTIPAFTADTLWYVNVRLTKTEAQKRGDKYMALAGSRLASLYNAEALLDAPVAVAVEGELDALLLQQFFAADELAVVTMGSATSIPSPRWKKYLAWLDKLLVVMDTDDAGERGLEKWREVVRWLEPVGPPDTPGKDVTDWWKNGADLRAWLSPYLTTKAPEKARLDAIMAHYRTRQQDDEKQAEQAKLHWT